MTVTVRVEGLREVERNLAKLTRATGKNTVRRALKAGGEILARQARLRAPRREYDLVESIDVGTRTSSRAPKQSPVEVYVGPGQLPQAIMQEFGTVHHPAQPFMRPAWDASQRSVLDEIAFSLFEEMQKALGRAARKAAK